MLEKIDKDTSNLLLDKRLILVVDSDLNSRILMQTLLKIHGATPVMAAQADEALRVLATVRPHLLISETILDGQENGYSLVRDIKVLCRTRYGYHIPAIALTAAALAGDREKALAAGFDQYITKPCNLDNLVLEIDALLKHQQYLPETTPNV